MTFMIRVRFAPSPTGFLHLGNARTALLNALFARHSAGKFILRIDDTDVVRSRSEYAQGIQQDLQWLGLHWDEMYQQSQRKEIYDSYFRKLLEMGRIYPCFETAEQLDAQRKEQLEKGLPPVYDRHRGQTMAQHDQPYWRFALTDTTVCWDDAIQGPMEYCARHLSDPVVMRQDGSMSYLLSSAIDDVDMGISHILRGADHLTNTAIQIQMMQALQSPIPVWAHFPLMFDAEGEKFSKRTGSKTLQELRQEGWLPLAIVQALAQLGLSRMVQGDLAEIAQNFSLSQYSKSNAKFSIHDIELVQTRLWATMDYADLSPLLQDQISPILWPLVRENIVHASDVLGWQSICAQIDKVMPGVDLGPLPDDFFHTAAAVLQHSDVTEQHGETEVTWAHDPWHVWVDGIMTAVPGCKKGLVCRALRMALTGKSGGPKMDLLLPMIAPKVALHRIDQHVRGHGKIEAV